MLVFRPLVEEKYIERCLSCSVRYSKRRSAKPLIYTSTIPYSECTVRKYINVLNLDLVLKVSNVSEAFLRDFKDRIDWRTVSMRQKISLEFVREFAHLIDWRYLSYNSHLTGDIIAEFRDKFTEHELAIMNHWVK
jgi:hypothetical protein